MVSIVTKFIVIYNDIVAVSKPYTDLRCESFPQCDAISILRSCSLMLILIAGHKLTFFQHLPEGFFNSKST